MSDEKRVLITRTSRFLTKHSISNEDTVFSFSPRKKTQHDIHFPRDFHQEESNQRVLIASHQISVPHDEFSLLALGQYEYTSSDMLPPSSNLT